MVELLLRRLAQEGALYRFTAGPAGKIGHADIGGANIPEQLRPQVLFQGGGAFVKLRRRAVGDAEDRFDNIVTQALLLQGETKPVSHEIAQGAAQLLLPLQGERLRLEILLQGVVEQGCRGEFKFEGHQDGDNPLTLAAQSIGILGSRRLDPRQEAAAQSVGAIGQREQGALNGGGGAVSGMARQVLLVDRRRRLRLFAAQDGVLAPHHPLQLGQFTDHAGNQIGLAELRCALCPGDDTFGCTQTLPDCPHQFDQPLLFLRHGAEGFVEDHPGKLRRVSIETLPAVFVVEETSVGQAGAENFLVAPANIIMVKVVADPDEGGLQGTVILTQHREVALVDLHRGDEHFSGQLQVTAVKGAGDRHRVLHQVGHLLEEGFIDERAPPHRCSLLRQLFPDHLTAFLLIEDDPVPPERVKVVVNAVDSDRPGRKKAVPESLPSRKDPGKGKGKRRGAVKSEQPAHRPGETISFVLPVHRPGGADPAEHAGQYLRQQRLRRLSGELFVGKKVRRPVHLLHHQRLRRKPLAAGKTVQGLRGRA